MFHLSSQHQFKNQWIIASKAGIGYFEAQGMEYTHATHYGDLQTSFGYQFTLSKINLSITPTLGVGLMAFDAQGEFTDATKGQAMYHTFGQHYFQPKFSQFEPQRYCVQQTGMTLFLEPSLSLGRDLTERMNTQLSFSYIILGTDGFDAYTFPVWANTTNDQFWSIAIGMYWKLGSLTE